MPTEFKIHWYGPGYDDAHHPGDDSSDVVIFIHGWGVKWPSKGTFVDIARHLSTQGVTSALFDLNDYAPNGDAQFLPLTDQQDRVRYVERYIRELFPSARLSIIAHSMGCRVLTTLIPELQNRIHNFVFLAPAVGRANKGMKNYILRHPGSFEAADGGVHLKRKDGTISHVSKRYLDEFNKDWDTLYLQNLRFIKPHIYLAETDHRNPEQTAMLESFGAHIITGSDHNFTGPSRASLLQALTVHF